MGSKDLIVLEEGDEERNSPGLCDGDLVVGVERELREDFRGLRFRLEAAVLEDGDERGNRPGLCDRDRVAVVAGEIPKESRGRSASFFSRSATSAGIAVPVAIKTAKTHLKASIQRAPAAFSFALSLPISRRAPSAGISPAFAIETLFSSSPLARFQRAPAAFSFAAAVPFSRMATSGGIAPASAIETASLSLQARFRRAPAAFSFALSLPFSRRVTSGGIAPAFNIETLFFEFLASFHNASAPASASSTRTYESISDSHR